MPHVDLILESQLYTLSESGSRLFMPPLHKWASLARPVTLWLTMFRSRYESVIVSQMVSSLSLFALHTQEQCIVWVMFFFKFSVTLLTKRYSRSLTDGIDSTHFYHSLSALILLLLSPRCARKKPRLPHVACMLSSHGPLLSLYTWTLMSGQIILK